MAELVAAAQRGDPAAWPTLVDRYVDLVWAVARGHCLDDCDAADVSQTTWLRLYEQLPRLTDPSRVGAWLVTTARRESLRVLRERKRQFPAVLSDHLVSDSSSRGTDETNRGDDPEGDERLWQAFAGLSASCQLLLRTLTVDPPPSYADLSEALGMPIGSIGPTRARCLDRLRANLFALAPPEPALVRKTVPDPPAPRRPELTAKRQRPEREVS